MTLKFLFLWATWEACMGLREDVYHAEDQTLMTRAHREAVQVTRLLGYWHIWIDALCIIQGDKGESSHSDWALQAHRVPGINCEADVTLLAGRSPDSHQEFVNVAVRSPSRPVKYNVIFANQQLIFWYQQLIHYEDGSNVSYVGLHSIITKPNVTKQDIFDVWNDAKEYSTKRVSEPFDRYVALSGVIKVFREELLKVNGGVEPLCKG
ncbi:hypothetical protein MKX08_002440 [Trichoderma sp. CBMAI-0020]|nr:hypothetical protein MKX08_002440 [Trichoderma sp. CBMAI-0020]